MEEINFTTDFRRNTLRAALLETIQADAKFHNADIGQGQNRIDIVVAEGACRIAIKLGVPMAGAQPNHMFDFVGGLALLERRLENGNYSKGFLVIVTNDHLFWEGREHDQIFKYFRTPTEILQGRIVKHTEPRANVAFHEINLKTDWVGWHGRPARGIAWHGRPAHVVVAKASLINNLYK